MELSTFKYGAASTTSFGCVLGATYNFTPEKDNYVLQIHKNHLSFDAKILKKFCTTITRWGFPVEYKQDGDHHIVTFINAKYYGGKHWLAAFSMIRYAVRCDVVFGYAQWNTEKVIPQMYEYKKKYKNLDLFQCFQLAQYKVLKGNQCSGHSCGAQVGTLKSISELKKELKNVKYMTSLFYKTPLKYSWYIFNEMLNKDEEGSLKLLQK